VAAARVGGGHEVAFVDATPLVEAAGLAERLLVTLDARPRAGTSTIVALADAVSARPVLVVLDNLEHLPGAASAVADIVRCGPAVRVLATSRVPLHMRGEHVFPLHPLPVPPPRRGMAETPEQATPALELFVDRVTAADSRFTLAPDALAASAAICRRLDGLPLAIELAASWVPVLGAVGLLERLDRALELLHEPGRDRPVRHLSLRATIAWSDALLSEPGREAFRRLAIFRGGFAPAAAVAVLSAFEACDDVSVLRRLAELPTRACSRSAGARRVRRASGCWRPSVSTPWSSSAPQPRWVRAGPRTRVMSRRS
jgi:predicted ATPase